MKQALGSGGGGSLYDFGCGRDRSPGKKSQVLEAIKNATEIGDLVEGTPVSVEYVGDNSQTVKEIGYFYQIEHGDVYLSRRLPIEKRSYSPYNYYIKAGEISSIKTLETGKSIV